MLERELSQVREVIKSRKTSTAPFEADLRVCLAVREAATKFVDEFGWLRDPLTANAELPSDEFLGLLAEARDSIEPGRHEFAEQYRQSISHKIDFIQKMIAGASLEELFQHQDHTHAHPIALQGDVVPAGSELPHEPAKSKDI